MIIGKISALLNLLFGSGPERNVPKNWLFRRSSQMDETFRKATAENFRSASEDGEFQYVTIAGKIYVWPKGAPLSGLAQILSELLQKEHPHHYDHPLTPLLPGDVVIDVGSCEGAFAAASVEKGASLVAIEPSRRMQGVIK